MPKNCEDIIFTLQCDDDNVILKYIHKVIVIVFHSSKQQYNIIIIRNLKIIQVVKNITYFSSVIPEITDIATCIIRNFPHDTNF